MRSRQDRGARTLSPASVEADASRGGLQPARRDLLIGLAGGAIGFGIGSQATAMPAETLPAGDDGTQDCQPFYGLHQSGVITPQPAAALIASFDVLAEDRAGLERLFRTLTERIAFLIKGGEAPTLDPRYPPPDSGLLGPTVFPDNLTVTVALGASLFDDRYGLQKVRPTRLISMEQFPNDALDARLCHGDVALQFCSKPRKRTSTRCATSSGTRPIFWRCAGRSTASCLRTRSRSSARRRSATCSDSRTAPPISTPATRR